MTTWRERLALADLGAEGIVLDLDTGSYFRANGSALVVLRALTAGASHEEAARRLCDGGAAHLDGARREVDALVVELERTVPRSASRNAVTVVADGDGWVLSHSGRAVARLSPPDRVVVVESSGLAPDEALRAARPHALALRGEAVLHASAVELRGGVTVFSGQTGAGKTTLARLLAARGARKLAEDFVVLGGDLLVEGDTLERGSPLRELLFLSPGRRAGSALARRRLSPAEALALLLENAFVEVPLRAVWTAFFERAREVVRRVPAAEVTLPLGLDALALALADEL